MQIMIYTSQDPLILNGQDESAPTRRMGRMNPPLRVELLNQRNLLRGQHIPRA